MRHLPLRLSKQSREHLVSHTQSHRPAAREMLCASGEVVV